MTELFHHHIPVLLNEAIRYLITSNDGTYVDATFGRGSHSLAILQQLGPQGRLIAFDKDEEAVTFGKDQMRDRRLSIYHRSFADMKYVLGEKQVQGILFDLGVSSPQLDDPSRGFSFVREGKLDMRMDTSQGMTAAEWLATVDETELANVLWQYGEERFSRRIAKAIIEARAESAIDTTTQLAKIISRVLPKQKFGEKHPATRSFQAIRIVVNQELSELELGLRQALDSLAINGRLAVISFHSLEDRIVKQFIRQHEKGTALPKGLPVKSSQFAAKLRSVGKAIKPTEQEIRSNPRARSAILRIAEKLS